MENVIGTKEAARLLGISQRTAARLAENGEVTAFKVGRGWVLNREEVEALAARRRENARQQPVAA